MPTESHTAGCNWLKISATPGSRTSLQTYSRQYQRRCTDTLTTHRASSGSSHSRRTASMWPVPRADRVTRQPRSCSSASPRRSARLWTVSRSERSMPTDPRIPHEPANMAHLDQPLTDPNTGHAQMMPPMTSRPTMSSTVATAPPLTSGLFSIAFWWSAIAAYSSRNASRFASS